MAAEKPLIVIVGPTASGKTGLAIKLAKKFDGEIISADSRAIYKYMDIGTAKPDKAEQAGIKHWGLDLVTPDQRFTVADFQNYAERAIADILARGKLPILVGGSGLYVDSVIFEYNFTTFFDADDREKLNEMSVEELVDYCNKYNIKQPENSKNKRYLVRAIERNGQTDYNRDRLRKNTIVVGITTDKSELMDRIEKRTDAMFDGKIAQETRFLAKKYSFELESMKSNIYPIVWRMLNGEISETGAKQLYITDDWHLAKKQITWFKRNKNIKWLRPDAVEKYIFGLLFE
ncbi:MAG: tRNA (adenosine(37)-N6)-dimethylallyltransferase MiaA [Candidatus Nomurabacteria bacterium]|jgi:tRNA dimethylallyltransferase|nr:tRNA (adenosine(37)-N6)-dimethylallyltransferase MiaA [Candidatus Nomurabacteria bacterium]